MDIVLNGIIEQAIASLLPNHDRLVEESTGGKIYVTRLADTKTGKPVYQVFADCKPRVYGSHTARSPKAAMKLVRYFRK